MPFLKVTCSNKDSIFLSIFFFLGHSSNIFILTPAQSQPSIACIAKDLTQSLWIYVSPSGCKIRMSELLHLLSNLIEPWSCQQIGWDPPQSNKMVVRTVCPRVNFYNKAGGRTVHWKGPCQTHTGVHCALFPWCVFWYRAPILQVSEEEALHSSEFRVQQQLRTQQSNAGKRRKPLS